MFQENFIWGAATSAYQVEGGAYEDGKGASIWDEYCRWPGKIYEGQTGEIACDHYHRYQQDVALMAQMGVKAYRFSIAWTRILPEGIGRVEKRGIEFYRNLLLELRKYGIMPYITLFHWDYPAALMRKGGWLNPDSPAWFEEYVRVVARELGDLAGDFFTFNEPEMIFGNSFVTGNLAPGYRMADGDVIRMIHNMLLAHGRAVCALRELLPGVRVGVALCSDPAIPQNCSPKAIEAARSYYYRAGGNIEELSFGLSWYGDPMLLGSYPKDGLSRFGKYLPKGWEEDLNLIGQKLDYQGHNVYAGAPVETDQEGDTVPCRREAGCPRTALDWPIDPESLYWGPRFWAERYKIPVIITENGLSCRDWVSLDGKVHDPGRIDYLHRHLLQLGKACEEGIPVLGYFQWSLMDNFEWASGYKERFGLIYVDFRDQKRIPKDSYYWYRNVIQTNGREL